MVLTGEVGTGKTVLLHYVLQLFKQSKDVAYAYIFNGRLSPVEFLQYFASDLGLPAPARTKVNCCFRSRTMSLGAASGI